jgi:hypothetical protein
MSSSWPFLVSSREESCVLSLGEGAVLLVFLPGEGEFVDDAVFLQAVLAEAAFQFAAEFVELVDFADEDGAVQFVGLQFEFCGALAGWPALPAHVSIFYKQSLKILSLVDDFGLAQRVVELVSGFLLLGLAPQPLGQLVHLGVRVPLELLEEAAHAVEGDGRVEPLSGLAVSADASSFGVDHCRVRIETECLSFVPLPLFFGLLLFLPFFFNVVGNGVVFLFVLLDFVDEESLRFLGGLLGGGAVGGSWGSGGGGGGVVEGHYFHFVEGVVVVLVVFGLDALVRRLDDVVDAGQILHIGIE